MCGISGFVDPELVREDARAQLEHMLARIAHRGPDDEGVWQEGPVAIGHRRLSIVDLSPLGHQPMMSASGRHVLAFNGEIYNHVALRAELEAEGERFKGHSDTEVLLALIERAGLPQALLRCVGMFAISLWDRQERTLHLARDRFGEKPLYYGWHCGAFVWGSELKALLSHKKFQRRLDPTAIALLIKYGYIPGATSIFENTYRLMPGHVLRLKLPDTSRGRLGPEICAQQIERYWSAHAVALEAVARPYDGPYAEAVDRLEALIAQAVRLQMQADVPLGAFLSGGIDSSLVVALMQRHGGLPVRTFSIGFEDPGLDEAPAAKVVAAQLGTAHTEQYASGADVLAVVPQLPEMYCEPMADPSQIPTHLVSRLARGSVTVSLSGDGGDELFGGYVKYLRGWQISRMRGRRALGALANVMPLSTAAHIARTLLPRHGLAWQESRIAIGRSLLSAPTHAAIAATLSTMSATYRALMKRPAREPVDLERYAVPPLTGADYLRTAMDLDVATYLPEDILAKVDRASMAVSLESRAPLLDHRVFEFAARLPTGFLHDGVTGKRILRDTLYRYVPRNLVDRPKSGFSPPLGCWLRGPLRDWAADLFSSTSGPAVQWLAMPVARALLERHVKSDQQDLAPALWPALTLLAWAQQHL